MHPIIVFGCLFLIALIFLFAPSATDAQAATIVNGLGKLGGFIIKMMSGFFYYTIVYPMTWFIMLLFQILTGVAAYQEFLDSPAVLKGWIVVRDFSNMFIILFLLIIAFGIMLRLESYGNRKMLVKLLFMAVMINFSKTICGFFIDMSTVVMLTFVNGFKFIMGPSLIRAMQLDKMLDYSTKANPTDSSGVTMMLQALATIVLTVFFVITIAVILVVMILTLLWRIVNLWVLVVLSPLAFLSSAVPFLSSFYSRWVKKFSNFLINGPILAFHLWLSLAIMNGMASASQSFDKGGTQSLQASGFGGFFADLGTMTGSSLTAAFTSGNISVLMVSCSLLVLSLSLANEFGAVGASKAYDFVTNTLPNYIGQGVKGSFKVAGKVADGTWGAATTFGLGKDLSVRNAVGLVKSKATLVGRRIKQSYHENKEKALAGRNLLTMATTGIGTTAFGNWTRKMFGGTDRSGLAPEKKTGSLSERVENTKDNVKGWDELVKVLQDLVNARADLDSAQQNIITTNNALTANPSNPTNIAASNQANAEAADKAKVVMEAYSKWNSKIGDPDVKARTGISSQTLIDLGNVGVLDLSGKMRAKTDDEKTADINSLVSKRDLESTHLENLLNIVAAKRGGYAYMENRAQSGEALERRLGSLKRTYQYAESGDDFAGALRSAFQRSGLDRQDHVFSLVKSASEKGVLDDTMERLQLEKGIGGLRTVLNRGANRPDDSKELTSDEAEIMNTVHNRSKSAGEYQYMNGTYTDGKQTHWADHADPKYTGVVGELTKQQKKIVELLERNRIPIDKLDTVLLQKNKDTGEQELNPVGKHVFTDLPSVAKQWADNTHSPIAKVIQDAFLKAAGELRVKVDAGVASNKYTTGHQSAFDALEGAMRTKKGDYTAGQLNTMVGERDNTIVNLDRVEKLLEALVKKAGTTPTPQSALLIDTYTRYQEEMLRELKKQNRTFKLSDDDKLTIIGKI